MMMKWVFTFWCLMGTVCWLWAQGNVVFVNKITIEGNHKTMDNIIKRELRFQEGDTIPLNMLESFLKESEHLMMNTGLFSSAQISFKNWEGATNKVHILVLVTETWYIYPVPIFELADRNFNVWWVEQNRSIQRINFGLEFTHLNFSGRRDKLKFGAKYGYTRSYSAGYQIPYINRSQTLGIAANMAYSRNRELNYTTVDNKQQFYRDPDANFIYQQFRSSLGLIYRPGHRLHHRLDLSYFQSQVSEYVIEELNPDFFLDDRQRQRYFQVSYNFSYDNRDVRPYPINGEYFSFQMQKDGLGIFGDRSALTLRAGYDKYFAFRPRWSLSVKNRGKLSLIRRRQPYNDYRALGFGSNTLAGYEYYIVDGMDMILTKSSFRFLFLKKELSMGKMIPIEAFRKMPIKMYFTLNNDIGYINDPFVPEGNYLSNRPLWGGGFGLDIVLYYDKVLQIQYSFNHLWEKGIFLHLNMNI